MNDIVKCSDCDNLRKTCDTVNCINNNYSHFKRSSIIFEQVSKRDGESCSPGCSGHVTHPCEKCGRTAAIGVYTPKRLYF